MAEKKYEKYIIVEPKHNFRDEEVATKDGPDVIHPTVYLDNDILEGASYVECN